MPEKYDKGTDIAKAHGHDTTSSVSPLYIEVEKSRVTAYAIPNTASAIIITPNVYHFANRDMTVSVFDFFSCAFSMRFTILFTVLLE